MMDEHGTALREAGLRITAGRVAVLDGLAAMPHVDADRLLPYVATRVPTTSIQSVHNILTDLTEAQLIRRIVPAGSAALYERRIGDNHHHLVCRDCGRVTDVDCVIGAPPCLTPSSSEGYQIESAEVTFWGTCSQCLADAAGEPRP
ncbi:Fur family transcriptional regulator [Agromyces rhizosphaerae]